MFDYTDYINSLKEVEIEIYKDEPMKNHTSFRIGGNADLFIIPKTEDAFIQAIKEAKQRDIELFVIGNGSNILFSDKGFRGIVISPYKGLDSVTVDDTTITVQSGALLSKIAAEALKNNLTGMECLAGIPGTLGGAVFMNAGAYGGQLSDVLYETRYLDENYEVKTITLQEHDFGYRKSVFKHHPEYIVLSSVLKLTKGDSENIKAMMADFAFRRKDKQPLNYPSAGSTFKRPEGYFAGKLIEDCGLKGFAIGDAQVSEKHAGFVINKGNATCADVLNLCNEIKKRVLERFAVELELEVRIMGEF